MQSTSKDDIQKMHGGFSNGSSVEFSNESSRNDGGGSIPSLDGLTLGELKVDVCWGCLWFVNRVVFLYGAAWVCNS